MPPQDAKPCSIMSFKHVAAAGHRPVACFCTASNNASPLSRGAFGHCSGKLTQVLSVHSRVLCCVQHKLMSCLSRLLCAVSSRECGVGASLVQASCLAKPGRFMAEVHRYTMSEPVATDLNCYFARLCLAQHLAVYHGGVWCRRTRTSSTCRLRVSKHDLLTPFSALSVKRLALLASTTVTCP